MGQVRIGISGWRYPPWRGVFYPEGLPQKQELSFASRAFPSIELNGSFYSLMRPESYAAWYAATPDDFVFAVKGGRFITHMRRLRGVEAALSNFFASGLLCLRHKLGPILWQLPPSLAFDAGRLRDFFALLPRSFAEISRLARGHDSRLDGRSVVTCDHEQVVRHALEVRHHSFQCEAFLELSREHGVAVCLADSAGLYPIIDAPALDFAYFRLHGAERLYVSGYSTRELRVWAERVQEFERSRDVYVYFDNDVKVRAPFDAQNLARLVAGQRPLRLPASLRSVTEEPLSEWGTWRGARRVS
jgi:uncharacterized protein YecE (DUF72 family)